MFIKGIYRVKVLNADRVPKEGGALLICNHMSYVDALLIGAACPRDVRFVMVERYMKRWVMGWFLRLFDVVPISPQRSKEAVTTTAAALRGGAIVCVFPEGQLSRTGLLNELKKGFQVIARQAGAPILPVFIDGLWGSIFSFERGKYIFKIPHRLRYGVTLNFGELIPTAEATTSRARTVLQDLSVDAFAGRPALRDTLATAVTRALKRRPRTSATTDLTGRRLDFSRATLLGTAEIIAQRWRRENTVADGEDRVGILLPHSSPAVIFEIALVLAGRVPVVFPLTSAPRAEELAEWGIRTVISSARVREHLPDFPWPEGFIDMAETFRRVSRGRLLLRWLAAYLEPVPLALWRSGRRKGDPEAAAAGYVGERPDGGHHLVTLSSRQIVANIAQLTGANFFQRGERILSEAPASTPEGNIFSLWYPLLAGNPLVTVSLAAEDEEILRVLDDENITVFLPRPTRWEALEEFDGTAPPALRLVLSFDRIGLDAGMRQTVAEKFGATLAPGSAHPGFGVVLSLSMADPDQPDGAGHPQHGSLDGAAGRLLPALSARITGEEGEPLSLEERGRLKLRGACLPDPGAWEDMNQPARFDRDGFLFLE